MDISGLEYKNVLEDKYSKIRLQTAANLIKPYLKDSVKILDIGSYTSDLLKILPQGIDYYGVDNDAEALKIAKERGAKTCRIDIESQKIPFENKGFDIIIAAEILEHLKDPEKIMSQIKDLLKPDGVVLISLPNECTLMHRINVLFGRGIDGTAFAPHYHMHFPTISQDDELVGKYFRIIEKRYWVHLGDGGAEKILSKITLKFWYGLVNLFPALFARGIIYLCVVQ